MLSFPVTPSLLNHSHLLHHRPYFSFTVRSSSSSSAVQEVEESSKSTADAGELSSELYVSPPFPQIRAAKRVVLVRHGQSTWNAEGRIQGSSDFSVLTKKGEAQAETSRQMLFDESFDVCFSSPLIRSKRTAEIIWGNRKEEILTDYDLREIDLYSFQVNPANFSIDGHYPVRELWARARNCWTKILAHESKSVLVVAHNAVNQALVATAIGLGTGFFRILLQSNCGVSVLDFTPSADGGSPHICLNRLNQTPNSPVAAGSSGGRKASKRIILVCYGTTQGDSEASVAYSAEQPMNMLGIIQAQKTAELLLDLNVSSVVSSPKNACVQTAEAISRDTVGVAPFQPGWLKGFEDEVLSTLWNQSGKVWQSLLTEQADEAEPEKVVVVVGHPAAHIALMGHCLNLTKEWMGSFHLDAGSVSVIDFPDGPAGRGVIRCINYTAHLGRWSIPITRSTVDDEEF
ncbi:2-carboxy-d-arabinitol-1-phosphatase-related [Citrus sinensis]|uniref:2-carboxy-d-arabinitol-1-phosphatase-related n=1 Tax=Citrus sinensis TaxID=2711 RepID=A0ACB8IST5_CITSI|nr:2-carboxy-d-arabinitol-1-phosphatase-related [Citrus sinensis]